MHIAIADHPKTLMRVSRSTSFASQYEWGPTPLENIHLIFELSVSGCKTYVTGVGDKKPSPPRCPIYRFIEVLDLVRGSQT